MPYPMKIQPVDFNPPQTPRPKSETAARPVLKWRFKRFFERPFSGVLKTSSLDKPSGSTEPPQSCYKDTVEEFEPSSVCLAKMVQNFIEENNEKQQQTCGRIKCNYCTDKSDDEPDSYNSSFSHAIDALKSLVTCSSISERNLLAETAKIVEKNKICKRKDEFCRKTVAGGLIALGYKASICRSKWEKTPTSLAGEYEYVDVEIEGHRLIIDIDFRSEFEIARSTKAYKQVLQTLPNVFVGKNDRLEKIISIVSEAAKQSLKKKGMPLPPWRKSDYVKAKWLSPFTRLGSTSVSLSSSQLTEPKGGTDEFELILGDKTDDNGDYVFVFSNSDSPCEDRDVESVKNPLVKKWEPLEIRPQCVNRGVKIVTGLASIIGEKS